MSHSTLARLVVVLVTICGSGLSVSPQSSSATSKGASGSSEANKCGYYNPGDGLGAAGINRSACVTTSPAGPTPMTSPLPHPAPNLGPPTNALQYLLGSLFSRPVPPPGAEVQPAYQPITAPKLMDADAFKAAGCDSITDTFQLINYSGSGSNAPEMENPAENESWKQLAKDLTRSSTEYVQDAKDNWERLKGDNTDDPLYRTVDALDMAATAESGEVPTTLKAVDSIATFGKIEEDVLDALAKGGVNDWLYKSGINEHDSGTVPPARAYLDNWTRGLGALQNSIQHFLPLAQGVEAILANDNVTKARFTVEEWTPVGLDAQALQDAIDTLKRCSRLIDQIRTQLRTARCDI